MQVSGNPRTEWSGWENRITLLEGGTAQPRSNSSRAVGSAGTAATKQPGGPWPWRLPVSERNPVPPPLAAEKAQAKCTQSQALFLPLESRARLPLQ